MVSIPLLIKDDIEYLRFLTQVNSSDAFLISRAFVAVTQKIVGLLKQSYLRVIVGEIRVANEGAIGLFSGRIFGEYTISTQLASVI